MKAHVTIKKAAAALLAVMLVFSLFGCGGGGAEKTSYVLKKDGVEYGNQVVEYRKAAGKAVYSCTERFPYDFQDTTIYRTLTFSSGMEDMLGYYSNRKVPGASYRSYMTRGEGGYAFLGDELQTFRFVPGVSVPGKCFPLEPDSVCLLQGITAMFLKSGVKEAAAFVIVPSVGLVVQQVILKRAGEGQVLLSNELLGEIKIDVDGSGKINRVLDSINKVEITRGEAGRAVSRPFEADTTGIEIKRETIEISDNIELAGSLYLPRGKKPYPAVILAGDFGPQDRTGNGVLSQIAVKLAGDGMAVLVCDKRGIPRSTGDYATYTLETARKDLNDQVDYMVMRGDIDINRIGVLGYGEGGALLAGVAPSNPYVWACVFMAAPSVRLFPDLPLRQIAASPGESQFASAEKSLEASQVENLTRLTESTGEDTVEIGGKRMFLGWMRSQNSRDPAGEFSSVKVPALVLQGGKDAVVDAGQASEITGYLEAGGNPDVELALFKGLDHNFGPLVVKPPYRKHPVLDKKVLVKISTWFKSKYP